MKVFTKAFTIFNKHVQGYSKLEGKSLVSSFLDDQVHLRFKTKTEAITFLTPYNQINKHFEIREVHIYNMSKV